MKPIKSFNKLEELGRVRLSTNFFMRDFLYSEIANFYQIQNFPEDPDLAIEVGKRICSELLEPLQATFGRITIRSAYRSREVNQFGNEHKHNCSSNEANRAGHIWDLRDRHGDMGGAVCIVVNEYLDHYQQTKEYLPMAWWIHDHLPYSAMSFHPNLCAFNISWKECPSRCIYSYIEPKGYLTSPDQENFSGNHSEHYSFLPELKMPYLGYTHSLTTDDYRRALEAIDPSLTPGHRAMLRAHYNAPCRDLTAAQLAAAAEYIDYREANLQYAAIGKKIADYLDVDPPAHRSGGEPFCTAMIADGYWTQGDEDDNWHWIMLPQVVAALPLTDWFLEETDNAPS